MNKNCNLRSCFTSTIFCLPSFNNSKNEKKNCLENFPLREPHFLPDISGLSSWISLSWSQWARICSRNLSTLASLLPRLSSGWEWTMLCRAAAALSLAALLPLVLPSNPESLSLPCNNWINKGRQPEKVTKILYKTVLLNTNIQKQNYVFCTKLISYTMLFNPKKPRKSIFLIKFNCQF